MSAVKRVTAGSLESNDVLILLEEHSGGNVIEIKSIVLAQFGPQIEASVADMLRLFHMENVRVEVQDKGAYDCTLRARMEAAIERYREARS